MRLALAAALWVAGLGLALGLSSLSIAQAPPDASAPPPLALFGAALEAVRSSYVDEVGDDKLVAAALNGMMASLDPHSSYLTPEAYDELRLQIRGGYGGVGLEITEEDGLVRVVSPIDDTPAAAAGLEPGDVIAKVDGAAAADLTLSELVARLRGPVGSSVVVGILRYGRDPFDVTLQRAEIKLKSVKGRIEGERIAYIRISSFIESTDTDLRGAFIDIERKIAEQTGGGKSLGLILDLRNDPGGLLDQANAVAGDFLDGGEIVTLRGREGKGVKRFTADPGDLAHGLPIVVLINGGSASASEIVAGALHDHHRAVLLGTRSFGKGSVQTIIPLAGRGALRLTIARYFTPSGRSIQAQGIDPDIVVEPARIVAFAADASEREADLRRALKNPEAATAPPPIAAPAGAAPTETRPDYQLGRAIALLQGAALFKRQTAD
jgi:carboxyl-terminal processing protease